MALQFTALKTMMTIFALVLGDMSTVVTAVPIANLVAPFIAALISSGSSLTGTMLNKVSNREWFVTCAVQVENWTRFPLQYPMVRFNNDAMLTEVATSILPRQREAFAIRKPRGRDEGTWGTVSWEMKGTNRRFVLLWSVPIDYPKYINWLGLGMTREGVTKQADGTEWFEQMYRRKNNRDLTFVRKDFDWNIDALVYRNDKFEVEGTMTSERNAEIRVIVRPLRTNYDHYAPSIRHALLDNEMVE